MSKQKVLISETIPTGFSLVITSRNFEEDTDVKNFIHGLSEQEALDRLIVLKTMIEQSLHLPLKKGSLLIPFIVNELESSGEIEKLSSETRYIIQNPSSSERLVWFLPMFDISSLGIVLPITSAFMSRVEKEIPAIYLEEY